MNKFKALVVKIEGTTILEESDVFIIEVEYLIKQEQDTDIVRKLLDKTIIYALLKSNDSYDNTNEYFATDWYRPNEFHGIMINIGVARKSIAGYN